MKRWAQTVQASVQMASELVAREWRSSDEWQAGSRVPRALFVQVAQWLEAFAGQPVVAAFLQHREQQRLLAKQVRDELAVLLAELEPQQAMAVLCSLPVAAELGYSQQHLARFAGLSDGQVHASEQEAYSRLLELVSQRTPFLQFLAGQVAAEDAMSATEPGAEEGLHLQEAERVEGEGASFAVEEEAEQERLLQEARWNPRFDLRLYMQPMEELSIRQRVHRAGSDVEQVDALFGEEAPFVVRLVMERMKLEMAEGEEEPAHVDDGSA